MAFHANSRYHDQPTVEAEIAPGRPVRAVKLRRIPATPGEPTEVKDHDRLDLLAHRHLGDATRYWRIADASSELDARRLTERVDEDQTRVIQVPKP
jgi:hypothetical protein